MTSSNEQLVPVEQIDYANAIHTMRSADEGVVLVREMIVDRGGLRVAAVMHGELCVETFSNGYDQITQKERDDAQTFARGYKAAIATLTPSIRAQALEEAAWLPIESAPYEQTVEIKVGSMTFLAALHPGVSEDDEGRSCDQWQAAVEGEHPPCWTDDACWQSNSNEQMSLQPTAWRALKGGQRV